MAKTWEQAGTVRRDFADLIESLSESQLDGPSLAGAWTPRHILGHVVYIAEMKMPRFMKDMAKARFDYDRMADTTARANAERPLGELLESLRTKSTTPTPMPGFAELVPVGDVAIHTQDVRRGAGLNGVLNEGVLATALEFVTTHKIGRDLGDLPGRDAVSYRATDLDWSHGSGPLVEGPAEVILMTLAGRDIPEKLDGEGVSILS